MFTIPEDDYHHKNGFNTGRRFPVGNKRLTVVEIAELVGKGPGYTGTCLNKESADKFIARMKRKNELPKL